jgi:macrodomain Ter protein organizer (MatP/YcbG family)
MTKHATRINGRPARKRIRTVTIRMTVATSDALIKIARARGCSRSDAICRLIDEALERRNEALASLASVPVSPARDEAA